MNTCLSAFFFCDRWQVALEGEELQDCEMKGKELVEKATQRKSLQVVIVFFGKKAFHNPARV